MMRKLYYLVRICGIALVRILLHIFYIFPVSKNKIVFASYGGIQYSCNPYYIYKCLIEKHPKKFDIYWLSTSMSRDGLTKDTYILPKNRLSFFFHILTATLIIDNDGMYPFLPFRKKQILINTWHGGGLFKQTYGKANKTEMFYVNSLNKMQAGDIKYFISSSESWSKIVARKSFAYRGKILNFGLPRNDVFFQSNEKIISKVKAAYHIPSEDKIVLYAPTFRGGLKHRDKGVLNTLTIDSKIILNYLEQRDNCKYHFLFRGHHAQNNLLLNDCINVSTYSDMQELLVSADIFITDYSSSLWDFSLTYKPCYIFAPDFDEYSQSPGFESDYTQWPFPIAKDNQSLLAEMKKFDSEEYVTRATQYHKLYGSYETGKAAQAVVYFMVDILYGGDK